MVARSNSNAGSMWVFTSVEVLPDLLLMIFYPEQHGIRSWPSAHGVTLHDGVEECYVLPRAVSLLTDPQFRQVRAELGAEPVSWLEVSWYSGDAGKDCADEAMAELAKWRPLVVWEESEAPQFLRPGHIPRHLV